MSIFILDNNKDVVIFRDEYIIEHFYGGIYSYIFEKEVTKEDLIKLVDKIHGIIEKFDINTDPTDSYNMFIDDFYIHIPKNNFIFSKNGIEVMNAIKKNFPESFEYYITQPESSSILDAFIKALKNLYSLKDSIESILLKWENNKASFVLTNKK